LVSIIARRRSAILSRQRAAQPYPRAVNQHVHPVEGLARAVQQIGQIVIVGDVGRSQQRRRAVDAEFFLHLRQRLRVQVRQHDRRPLRGKRMGRRPSDARRRPRHDHDLVLQAARILAAQRLPDQHRPGHQRPQRDYSTSHVSPLVMLLFGKQGYCARLDFPYQSA
jgi:hypothetical protein